jgi:hypothetical protein
MAQATATCYTEKTFLGGSRERSGSKYDMVCVLLIRKQVRGRSVNVSPKGIGEYAEKAFRVTEMVQETTRLDLLAGIESTVDAMTRRSRAFRKAIHALSDATEEVASCRVDNGDFIDPDFLLVSAIEASETRLKSFLMCMLVRRTSICKDTRLTPDHREFLCDAYDDVAETAALLHDALKTLRHAIGEHDSAAEDVDALPVFETTEALIADLRGA